MAAASAPVPRPSLPLAFDLLQYAKTGAAYCKRSKTGAREGLGMRLIYIYFRGIYRPLNFAGDTILALFFRNKKKDELLDEEVDNKQDEASSSSASEEQNANIDCEDLDTG